MRTLGIDIGSRTIKLVLVQNGEIIFSDVRDTTYTPLEVCRELVSPLSFDTVVATGYGRRLFQAHWPEAEVITELKAVSAGARHLFPTCRTIIDIGGQDTKVVSLDRRGNMLKFAMNDRCAAGTGRFLEVMAGALAFTLEELVAAAEGAKRAESLSSMCTVFAETEVVSLVAREASRDEIALGLHQSIATRTAALAGSIAVEDEVIFAGGGAHNSLLKTILEKQLNRSILVPISPQTVAALGCALHPPKSN